MSGGTKLGRGGTTHAAPLPAPSSPSSPTGGVVVASAAVTSMLGLLPPPLPPPPRQLKRCMKVIPSEALPGLCLAATGSGAAAVAAAAGAAAAAAVAAAAAEAVIGAAAAAPPPPPSTPSVVGTGVDWRAVGCSAGTGDAWSAGDDGGGARRTDTRRTASPVDTPRARIALYAAIGVRRSNSASGSSAALEPEASVPSAVPVPPPLPKKVSLNRRNTCKPATSASTSSASPPVVASSSASPPNKEALKRRISSAPLGVSSFCISPSKAPLP